MNRFASSQAHGHLYGVRHSSPRDKAKDILKGDGSSLHENLKHIVLQ